MKKVLSIPGQMLISGVMSGIAMEVVAFLAGKRAKTVSMLRPWQQARFPRCQ
jgi:hypothetical protein